MEIKKICCGVKHCTFNYKGECERSSIELYVTETGVVKCHSVDYSDKRDEKKDYQRENIRAINKGMPDCIKIIGNSDL
jgi:hypothetical protein